MFNLFRTLFTILTVFLNKKVVSSQLSTYKDIRKMSCSPELNFHFFTPKGAKYLPHPFVTSLSNKKQLMVRVSRI